MKLELKDIKNLAKSVKDNNLSEISIETEGIKLVMKKEGRVVSKENFISTPILANMVESEVMEEEKVEEITGKEIVSPMVGTFYLAPSPEAEPFVKIGDNVNIGDTLCIVEAMKMMNEIKATENGKILEIVKKNGEIVKKGEILFKIG